MTQRILLLLTLLVAQAIPSTAQSREKGLDRWLDADLIPYVRQQLLSHPRFKNETVMFVIMRDNAPASNSNALALSLRDRLLASAVDTAGVSIGWQQGRKGAQLASRSNDCSRDAVHYYIGLELTQGLDSRYSVSVRALDLEDLNWVTGFGKRWQGRLSTIQRQAMRQRRVDETFLGARDVPFTLEQTDLLAAYLAHELSCTLRKQVANDYVVVANVSDPAQSGLAGTIELIGNNLANEDALALTADASKTNAVMTGKAHRIDGVLFQYWLTVTPLDNVDDLAALSASAYIVLPNVDQIKPKTVARVATNPVRPTSVSIPNAGKDALIDPLRITASTSSSDCRGPCSLLSTRARVNSVVFFLQHQANHGLVRLSGNECRARTAAKIARGGEALSFPIAKTTTASRNWSEIYDWQLKPELDTYYAVVVTDAQVARQVANLFDSLPLRCSSSMRPGLDNDALREWLSEFAVLAARASQHMDWRAISIHDLT
jgi:hypothetical protein